ncbi:excinuclease ABC subunit UvrC [Vulgatibacter incomptus]|uniref:UvrABC system protein C n=1 Tax=Vulgatibacter incomptus TaxID=1391653 RepID=A0A0K1PB69_9BACT|nr:excinuclease ABC subunit UvrC [Vulgatibacter incomptus]AKU90737.1 Excinuclease ABC subunit C [Vulgatibacter incomptus]
MDAALRQKLDDLPVSPGVYLMKDREGEVVYVGKAVNLRSRVRSYFQPSTSDTRAFVPFLDELLGDIEVILVHNEKEALILESTLIKRHKPRFNVMLRDDKAFICLRLDERHPYPRLEVVRRMKRDGARYFGPYSSATAIRETLRTINRFFQLRTCTDQVLAKRTRPCLLFQIKRCPAPCVYEVPQEEYRRSVRETVLFLEGKEPELVEGLRLRMKQAAADLRFEEAAQVRDQVRAIEKTLEKQQTVFGEQLDQDVFGFWREGPSLVIEVLFVRTGKLISAQSFPFTGQEFPTEELLASFIDQYYATGAAVPDEVLLPVVLEQADFTSEVLSERKGRKVRVMTPMRGDKKRLMEMATKNAEHAFLESKKKNRTNEEILERLQQRLELQRLPRRIECFDISNFQGTMVVASQVAALDGEADKARYRHYRIKTVEGQDDFASMYEVISRRVARGDLPDLLLIDGGKGQLNAARAAVKDAGVLDQVELASLAESHVVGETADGGVKRSPERVFLPGKKDPLVLRPNSAELFVLQRLRDEAHRFAITFHQKLRRARNFQSILEEIPGVGEKRRRSLLRHFGSLKRIRSATAEEIAEVEGFNLALGKRIAEFLARPEEDPDRDSELPEGAAQSMDAAAEVAEAVQDPDQRLSDEEEAIEAVSEVGPQSTGTGRID